MTINRAIFSLRRNTPKFHSPMAVIKGKRHLCGGSSEYLDTAAFLELYSCFMVFLICETG